LELPPSELLALSYQPELHQLMKRIRIAAVALSLLAAATDVSAQAIDNRATGLSGTPTTIDFNGLPYLDGQSITNQIPGVTFSPNVFYCATAGCSGGTFAPGYLANFNSGSFTAINPFEIIFSSAVSSAAFQLQAGFSLIRYDFWMGAANVGSYVNMRGCCGDSGDFLWNGWENSEFNRITISAEGGDQGAMILDNLQYQSTVPEPASMLLIGTGLAGVAAARRRRKKKQDA
jgi:hypothetical protein